ncbi:acyl-CoA dehydrogenase family protein [Sporosarcina aquimarina]|uniref:acyl-CoA dehydrogenase family protein n=1 Tax=Sporosarcina aquimarina TaxID=114975 RepID=UPI001C8EC9F2|nr:acyl-CoA dehydrogenase family protein [Sporosarcina aquimarina]MBY0223157.1 acyl-CoA dehydrogenase [Sporosarcina aquimarina]
MFCVKKNPQYTFDSFLAVKDTLDDLDNPFLVEVLSNLSKEDWGEMHRRLQPFANKLSTSWRATVNEIARPENHPKLRQYDAYNRRIDRIVRPAEALKLTEEVFGEGLFSMKQLTYEGIMKRYLLHGNGEAGITCPVACTDGLIELIEAFYEEVPKEVKEIHAHAKEGIDGNFAIGAQFMSEIQGGSNIPANLLEAVPMDSHYLLYGNKFFCSAVHADYSVVTAKIEGTENIAVFVVPSYLPGDKEKELRNGYRINRLKWKLGTSELPSGEIDYEGAVAYRIGPEDRGVALAVGIVLTRSRLDIGFASAAFVMRAAREAKLYARFRHVFDRTIDGFPMAAAQLEELEGAAKRMTATAFHLYKMFLEQDDYDELQQFALRELILLQKIYAAKEAVDHLRLAISLFGGHGAIEDFSAIPRLFRDSLVNELWEGPRNVLLTQIYRDLFRLRKTVPIETVLETMFPHLSLIDVTQYTSRIEAIMGINIMEAPTPFNKMAAMNWESLWEELFLSFQQAVTKPFEEQPILREEILNNL